MIPVRTDRYEAAHGKKPRGRELWLFEIMVNGPEASVWFEAYGSFREARRKAVAEAKRIGGHIVIVGP